MTFLLAVIISSRSVWETVQVTFMQLRDVKCVFAGKTYEIEISSQHRSFVSQLSLWLLESIWRSTTLINGTTQAIIMCYLLTSVTSVICFVRHLQLEKNMLQHCSTLLRKKRPTSCLKELISWQILLGILLSGQPFVYHFYHFFCKLLCVGFHQKVALLTVGSQQQVIFIATLDGI